MQSCLERPLKSTTIFGKKPAALYRGASSTGILGQIGYLGTFIEEGTAS